MKIHLCVKPLAKLFWVFFVFFLIFFCTDTFDIYCLKLKRVFGALKVSLNKQEQKRPNVFFCPNWYNRKN